MIQITKDTEIEELVKDYPQVIGYLQNTGIQCVICGEPVWGTLEQKAGEKGIDNLADIVRHLNKLVNDKSK